MKKISMILALLVLSGTVAFADGIKYEPADSSAAIRVYNGYTGTVSVVITTNGAGSNLSVTLDGNANTIDGNSASYDIVSELSAAIAACTNASGEVKLIVDTACALATDSTDGELLDGTYTAAAGKWLEIPWDTSIALHYDVYIPGQAFDKTRGAFVLDNIYGSVLGTGAVTLNVYVGGSLAWDKVFSEPSTVSGTNDSTYVLSNQIDLPIDVNIPVTAGQSVLVRASRATTATTGLLGVHVKQ